MLLNSYWLIYIVSLAPLIGVGLMIVLIMLLVYNSREISDALGFGMARKRRVSKRRFTLLQLIISGAAWAIAIETLLLRCGSIFCRTTPTQTKATNEIINDVSGNFTISKLPLLETVNQLSNLVQSNWYYLAFLGLLAVTSVIMVRGIVVSWKEIREEGGREILEARADAITSVEDAFHILSAQQEADPRTRIINCYQRMVQTAQRSGARVTADQTARELEAAIRLMLRVQGSSIRELTNLFEEARYSLHPITENDAEAAQQCLLGIANEMNITLT